jgi:hypothetical protein
VATSKTLRIDEGFLDRPSVASRTNVLAKSLQGQARMKAVLGIVMLVGCTADVAGIEGRDKPKTSGDDTGGGSGSTSITLSKYFDEIADIHCEQAFQCKASFPPDLGYTFEAQWGASLTECTQTLLAEWNPAQVETEIAKGRITYDGTAAVTCLEGVAFAACPDYWNRGIEWAESCYHVVVGMVATGGACENNYSCTSYACDATTHVCM